MPSNTVAELARDRKCAGDRAQNFAPRKQVYRGERECRRANTRLFQTATSLSTLPSIQHSLVDLVSAGRDRPAWTRMNVAAAVLLCVLPLARILLVCAACLGRLSLILSSSCCNSGSLSLRVTLYSLSATPQPLPYSILVGAAVARDCQRRGEILS